MEILQPLSTQKLNEILALIHENRPKSIHGYNYIYNYLINCDKQANTNISDRCKPTFYGKYNGIIENCTYIAITGSNDYRIFLYTFGSGQELYECLEKTSRINWKAKEICISIESEYFVEVDKIVNEKRTDWSYCTPEGLYYLPKEIAIGYDLSQLSKNFCLKTLTLNDAVIINENWPHKYTSSLKFIASILEMNGGTGLYKDDILIAWIAINNLFSPGFLQTLEKERRKGYANIVCKAECQRIAKIHNIDILVYIAKGNIPSEMLFKKLGFICVNEIRWIQVKNYNL